jgi:hypothetical protein
MRTSAVCQMILCAIFAGGFWLAFPGAAEPSRGEEKTVVDLSNEEIQAFAKANVKVAKIQTASAKRDGSKVIDLNAPIEELPKEKKIPTIQAIEAQGLTVAKYNKLLKAYQSDEEFRSQVVRAFLNLHPEPDPLGCRKIKC